MLREGHPLLRYGAAVLFTALAAVLRVLLDPVLLESPGSLIFVLAILASSYIAGPGPSLFSAVLSSAVLILFWIEPRYGLQMHAVEWLHLSMLLITAVAVNGVTENLVRARLASAEHAQRAIEARDALRESEARFAGFMRHLPGAAWIEDAAGRLVYFNDHARAILEQHLDGPILGRRLEEMIPSELAERLRGMDARIEDDGHAVQSIEPTHCEGDACYHLFHKFPIPGEQGRARFMAGLMFDVTDRERAITALNEAIAFRHAMEQALLVGVQAVDTQGQTQYVSPAFSRMVGWSIEELMKAREPFPYWPEEELDTNRVAFSRVLAGGWPAEGAELRFCRKDGMRFDVLVQAAPMHDPTGRIIGWVGSFTDVTQRKEVQRQLTALTQTLEQRVTERTEVAERRAMQLRLLNAQLIQTERRERQRLAKVLHDDLQQLLVAAKFKLTLVSRDIDVHLSRTLQEAQEILSDSIHASRSLTQALSPTMLEKGLVPALEWLARSMGEKHHLVVRIALDEQAEPDSDEVRTFLFETIRELLFNVVKHAQVQEAQVSLVRREGELQVTVADDGVGFDPAEADREMMTGEHFGILSVRERLDAMGGCMTIDSAPGKGTRVTLKAPLGNGTARSAATANVASGTASAPWDRANR